MSWLSSAWKSVWGAAKTIAPQVVGYAVGGPVGAAIGGAIGGGGVGAPAAIPASGGGALATVGSKALTVLPGAGAVAGALGSTAGRTLMGVAGGAAAGAVAGKLLSNGQFVPTKRRRRRRGISAAELRNHARVERFLDKNFKCKHGGSRGTHLRKRTH